MKQHKETPPDRSVLGAERSLTILNAFVDATEPLGLKELEAKTGLFKSVICRYMLSFTKHGYIIQKQDGSYQLGPRAFQLGKSFERLFDYADFIIPTLEKLAKETKESAAFFIKQENKRLCLYAVDSYEPVKAIVKAGALFEIDSTSSSQVLRFFSIKGNAAQSQGRYICLSSGINNALSSSMSAPIFGVDNVLIGSLTIFGLSLRFDPMATLPMREKLLSFAQELSAQLGARSAYHNPNSDIFITSDALTHDTSIKESQY